MSLVDFAVITPLAVEWHAVKRHLEDLEEVRSHYPTARGRIGPYNVVVRMPLNVGGYAAGNLLNETLNEWSPQWVALVGVAGGFGDVGVNVGDVVVASRIYPYEYGKIRDSGYERRDIFDIPPDPVWVTRTRSLAEEPTSSQSRWQDRILVRRPDRRSKRQSRLHIGPIASGEKVVDNPDYQFFAEARANLPDLYAIEMEAAGAGTQIEQVRSRRAVGFFMVRGISDVPRPYQEGDDQPRGTDQRDDWKPYAAAAAAAFLEHLLVSPGGPPSRGVTEQSGADTFDDLRDTLSSLTRETAATLRGRVPTTPRPAVNSFVDDFMASSQRWGVLVGQPGVGKSVVMAQTATRLLDSGWSVLLLRGSLLDLSSSATTVTQRMGTSPKQSDWHHLFLETWTAEVAGDSRGLAIVVDGLDEGDASAVKTELMKLSDALHGVPLDRVKVLVSSGEIAWDQLRVFPPFVGAVPNKGAAEGVALLTVGDFSEDELNGALEAIDAREYSTSRWIKGRSDPHIDTVRELIGHPATFAIFAELYQAESLPSIEELTWVGLVERFVDRQLRRVGRQCAVQPATVREYLISLADLAWKNGSRDFRLDSHDVNSELPEINVNLSDATTSVYAALLERGVLEEMVASGGRRLIGFRLRSVGSYFLSFSLERSADLIPAQELADRISAWIEGVYDYPPIIDAVTAWIHRLPPQDKALQALVNGLIKSPSLRLEVVFRMMPSASAQAILGAAVGIDVEELSPYRQALMSIRPSARAREAFRNGLASGDPRVLGLSIRAAGASHDVDAIEPLIGLLDHEDEEIRGLVVNALGLIGAPASPILASLARNPDEPRRLRNASLIALRAVGYRTEDVNNTIAAVLSEKDAELQQSALLAAAAMGVSGFTDQASAALSSEEPEVALAGAKLLTEVPDPTAEQALLNALEYWEDSDEHGIYKFPILRQLAVAIAKGGGAEARTQLMAFAERALREETSLSTAEAIWLVEKLPLQGTTALVLERTAVELGGNPITNAIWQYLRLLANVWTPDESAVLRGKAKELRDRGVDIGLLTTDALIASYERGESHPLNEPSARKNALRMLTNCGLPDLPSLLARLLPRADWPLDQKTCDVLGLLGDPSSEEVLLEKLTTDEAKPQRGHRRHDAPLYALATCGSAVAADRVLDHLKSGAFDRLSIDVPEMVLKPMMARGVLEPHALVQLALDEDADEDGRLASLLALAATDPKEHADIFRRMLHEDVGVATRAYAAGALGLSGDKTHAPVLLKLLRSTPDSFIADRTALALAHLGYRPAIGIIESLLADTADSIDIPGLVNALAVFKEPRSIPVLLDALGRTRYPHVRNEIVEALGEFLPHQAAREALMDVLSSSSGGWEDRGQQIPAVDAFARHAPDVLLDLMIENIDSAIVEPSAKQALLYQLPSLVSDGRVNEGGVVELMVKLVSDHDFWVREQAAQAMVRFPENMCQRIFEEAIATEDEWKYACAIQTIGYWSSEDRILKKEYRSPLRATRKAARDSMQMHTRRRYLSTLVDYIGGADMPLRVFAVYALDEHGDESTIFQLHERYPEDLAVPGIVSEVNRRRRDEHRKLGNIEDRQDAELGTVAFD